jgi:uncharacterized peroxidase-related enzyme
MPHIALPEGLPGISAGFVYRPETAIPMRELAHILLHEAGPDPSSLTPAERELIATSVSAGNNTKFCALSHGAAATAHLGGNDTLVKQVKTDFTHAEISSKLKALLAIAEKVRQDGKLVTSADVELARREGATDLEIHDTVLIAAAFSMFNRYVDGLGTWQPDTPEMYARMGRHLAEEGYRAPSIKHTVEQAVAS